MSLPGVTGDFVSSQPVAAGRCPASPTPVPCRMWVPSEQVKLLPPAVHGGPAVHPHASRKPLLTLTGLPWVSNEMLPSCALGGAGSCSATKKSLYEVQTKPGHS